MKILITGGAGYLGTNLVGLLSEHGFNCLVFDNFTTGHKKFIQEFNFVEADIRDSMALEKCFSDFKPEIIIHLASIATVGECEERTELCKEVNVDGTKNILEAMLKHNIKKIIFASSAAVYKPSDNLLKEDAEVAPTSNYGFSQLSGEKIIEEYKSLGINSVIFRIFNIAGADQKNRFGELHNPETHLVPLVIEAILKQQEIKIFGDDYNTKDGTAIRDYIHVTDVASAFLLACNYMDVANTCPIFNIGSGNALSVLEVVEACERVINKQAKKQCVGKRNGDVATLVANNEAIKSQLNWLPQCSEIQNIVQTAYQWYLKNNE